MTPQNKIPTTVITVAIGLFAVSPGLAADLNDPAEQPSIQLPSPSTSVSIEYDPEFNAISSSTKTSYKHANGLLDNYIKASVSHTFSDGLIWGGSFYYYDQVNHGTTAESNKDTYQRYVETTLGYRFSVWGPFSLTPYGTLGYTWGATGIVKGNTTNRDVYYYAANLAGDWKIDSHWTWNVFNLRYRNAFDYRWVTPKVATGATYNFDPYNAVYASIGYAWKSIDNKGAVGHTGLLEDKWNLAVGYRRSF
jgi:hypothetical protein